MPGMPDHTEQKLDDQIKALQNVSVFAKNQYNLSTLSRSILFNHFQRDWKLVISYHYRHVRACLTTVNKCLFLCKNNTIIQAFPKIIYLQIYKKIRYSDLFLY